MLTLVMFGIAAVGIFAIVKGLGANGTATAGGVLSKWFK